MRCFLAICAATFSLTSVASGRRSDRRMAGRQRRCPYPDRQLQRRSCGASFRGKRSRAVSMRKIPNPAERNRPLLGSHVLLAMRPIKPGRWDGRGLQRRKWQDLPLPSQPDLAGRACASKAACSVAFSAAARTGRGSRPSRTLPAGRRVHLSRASPAQSEGQSGCGAGAHGLFRRHGRFGGGPLGRAEIAPPPRACRRATRPAACPCSTCPGGSKTTGCRRPSRWWPR